MDLNLKYLDNQIELFMTHQLWVPELDMPLRDAVVHVTDCAYWAGYCARDAEFKAGRVRRRSADAVQMRLDQIPRQPLSIVLRRRKVIP